MSHRHTINTSITNKEIAKQALQAAKVEFREQGDQLFLTSGNYRDTVIDTRSGRVTSGDTDHVRVSAAEIGVLRQHYTEALHRHEAMVQGIEIQSRSTRVINGEDCVVLHCRMA